MHQWNAGGGYDRVSDIASECTTYIHGLCMHTVGSRASRRLGWRLKRIARPSAIGRRWHADA